MRLSSAFVVAAPPEDVAAYLANPRHLLLANHEGPIVEQSDPPVQSGSWFVLAFDQLRVRVEYTVIEAPNVIEALVVYSGRGSAGMRGTFRYGLAPASGGETRVTLDADVFGSWIARAVGRLSWGWSVRALRRRMETGIHPGAASW